MGHDAVDFNVAKAEHNFDGQRQRSRVTDERPESHRVDHSHRPRVLVTENLILTAQVLTDSARDHLQTKNGQRDHDRQNDPFRNSKTGSRQSTVYRWQHQPRTKGSSDEADQQHTGDGCRRAEEIRNFRRNVLVTDVVHAHPADDRQRYKEDQPDQAGVLDISLGARRNLADQRPRSVHQCTALTTE